MGLLTVVGKGARVAWFVERRVWLGRWKVVGLRRFVESEVGGSGGGYDEAVVESCVGGGGLVVVGPK